MANIQLSLREALKFVVMSLQQEKVDNALAILNQILEQKLPGDEEK